MGVDGTAPGVLGLGRIVCSGVVRQRAEAFVRDLVAPDDLAAGRLVLRVADLDDLPPRLLFDLLDAFALDLEVSHFDRQEVVALRGHAGDLASELAREREAGAEVRKVLEEDLAAHREVVLSQGHELAALEARARNLESELARVEAVARATHDQLTDTAAALDVERAEVVRLSPEFGKRWANLKRGFSPKRSGD